MVYPLSLFCIRSIHFPYSVYGLSTSLTLYMVYLLSLFCIWSIHFPYSVYGLSTTLTLYIVYPLPLLCIWSIHFPNSVYCISTSLTLYMVYPLPLLCIWYINYPYSVYTLSTFLILYMVYPLLLLCLWYIHFPYSVYTPGRVAQMVTCLATDACLTADPGVVSSILVRSHTFVEIDHEMISAVILLPRFRCSIQERLLSVTSEIMCTNYWLTACPSVVMWTDRPAMTIAVDLGRKATKHTNKQNSAYGLSTSLTLYKFYPLPLLCIWSIHVPYSVNGVSTALILYMVYPLPLHCIWYINFSYSVYGLSTSLTL